MTAREGQRWADDLLAPCGTRSAYRRHLRRDEPVDFACREAERVGRATDRGLTVDPRPIRNGVPSTPRYQYRARRYPLAEEALRRAEAEYGRPASEAS